VVDVVKSVNKAGLQGEYSWCSKWQLPNAKICAVCGRFVLPFLLSCPLKIQKQDRNIFSYLMNFFLSSLLVSVENYSKVVDAHL